eukprot:scaffold2308_cov140-Amphora_coffeaeformis.AAC.1
MVLPYLSGIIIPKTPFFLSTSSQRNYCLHSHYPYSIVDPYHKKLRTQRDTLGMDVPTWYFNPIIQTNVVSDAVCQRLHYYL